MNEEITEKLLKTKTVEDFINVANENIYTFKSRRNAWSEKALKHYANLKGITVEEILKEIEGRLKFIYYRKDYFDEK